MSAWVDDGISIDFLADRPELAEICGAWENAEWGLAAGRPLEADLARFENARRDSIPVTLVACSPDGAAIGMVSLWTDDCPLRPDLTPWIASLYVPPTARGRGIGTRLFARIQEVVAGLAYRRLHLLTQHSEAFYAGHGWEVIDHVNGPGAMQNAVVMRKNI